MVLGDSGCLGAIRQVSYDFGVLGGVACFRRCLFWWCWLDSVSAYSGLKFANFAVL